MPARSSEPPNSPFRAHDYQIVCLPPEAPLQVNIHGSSPLPLQVGDHYTIGRSDWLCDLIVEEISHFVGGRWNARCHVSGLVRL